MENNEMRRYSLEMSDKNQRVLAKIAKDYKISQSEVLEALTENIDMNKMEPVFIKIREDKVAGRTQKKEFAKKLAKLDPSQIQAIQNIIGG